MPLPAVKVNQTWEDKFKEYLATRNPPKRFTNEQRDIIRQIFPSHRHFDVDELIDDLKKAEIHLGRATVYRTLTKLVDAGLLRRHDVNGRSVYEHDYGYPQHEHLVCEMCNRMIEFQHPAIDTALREIAARHEFQVSGHTLMVHGICADCNRKRARKRRLDLI